MNDVRAETALVRSVLIDAEFKHGEWGNRR